jgi:hypothetical protein
VLNTTLASMLGGGLDSVPELDDAILNVLNIDRTGNMVNARHLFNVGLTSSLRTFSQLTSEEVIRPFSVISP